MNHAGEQLAGQSLDQPFEDHSTAAQWNSAGVRIEMNADVRFQVQELYYHQQPEDDPTRQLTGHGSSNRQRTPETQLESGEASVAQGCLRWPMKLTVEVPLNCLQPRREQTRGVFRPSERAVPYNQFLLCQQPARSQPSNEVNHPTGTSEHLPAQSSEHHFGGPNNAATWNRNGEMEMDADGRLVDVWSVRPMQGVRLQPGGGQTTGGFRPYERAVQLAAQMDSGNRHPVHGNTHNQGHNRDVLVVSY